MAELAGKPPRLSVTDMTELVMPNDANPLGNIMGGRVMHLIDVCAGVCAARHAGTVCVTASVDYLDFRHPIKVGEVIELRGVVTWAGRTSIELMVEVYAEGYGTGRRLTSTAFLTFVALDQDGQPTAVPPVLPETPEEKRRYEGAEQRRAVRMAQRQRDGR